MGPGYEASVPPAAGWGLGTRLVSHLLQGVQSVLHQLLSPHSDGEGVGDSAGPVSVRLRGFKELHHLATEPRCVCVCVFVGVCNALTTETLDPQQRSRSKSAYSSTG